MAIRTGWLDDVDLTGRGWWDVAQEIQQRHGSGAVTALLNENFFEQFGSFSAADRAKLWEFVGGARAGEQAAADDDLKDALKSVIGGAIVGTTSGATGIAVGAGLDPAQALKLDATVAGSALMPWLGGIFKGALPALPSVSSLVPTQVSQALTAFDTVRSFQPGAWLNEYFDPAAAVGGTPQFFADSQGGGGMDIRESFRALLAPLLILSPFCLIFRARWLLLHLLCVVLVCFVFMTHRWHSEVARGNVPESRHVIAGCGEQLAFIRA